MFLQNNPDFIPLLPFKFAAIGNPTRSFLSMSNGGTNNGIPRQQPDWAITTVSQALEIARDTPEGAQDPTIVDILETALTAIWRKIEAQPASYVMTRDEFAVFNYFQGRFAGQQLAAAARKRYWNHFEINNGA